MSDRDERVARNEALFRTVNDEIDRLNDRLGTESQSLTLACECADRDCSEQIEFEPDRYRLVRQDPTLFIVRPEHDAPDTEETIARGHGFWVVRKHPGKPQDLARNTSEQD